MQRQNQMLFLMTVLTAILSSAVAADAQQLPDLTIEKIDVIPSTLKPGLNPKSKIQVTIKNMGEAPASGTLSQGSKGYVVDVFYSKDTKPPSGFAVYLPNFKEDVLVKGGRFSNTPDLAPGQSYTYPAVSSVLPNDTPPGKYFVCASVDAGKNVSEKNEANNTACSPISVLAVADLIATMTSGDATVGKCAPGHAVYTFNVTVKNLGTGPTPSIPGKVLVQVRSEEFPNWANGVEVAPIPPGGSKQVKIPLYYPKKYTEEMKMKKLTVLHFRVIADPLKLVDELDEENNVLPLVPFNTPPGCL